MDLEQKYINSKEVAEMVGKDHSKLLRDVRNYIEQLNQSKIGFVDFFVESTYTDNKGEIRPCYLVTKKGCEFIAHKLTGVKGTEFTARLLILKGQTDRLMWLCKQNGRRKADCSYMSYLRRMTYIH